MEDTVPDCSDKVFKFFGEREGFTDESRDSLTHGIVKSLDVIRVSGFFSALLKLIGWEDVLIGLPEVRVDFPQPLGSLTRSISHKTPNDSSGISIQS